TRRDGLTLVEVLVSLVLLTILTTALLPLLHEARGAKEAPQDSELLDALAMLADQVIAKPAAFGLAATQDSATLPWPQNAARAPVVIRCATAPSGKDEDTRPRLMVFECGDIAVARWWPIEAAASVTPPEPSSKEAHP